jgi:hypothetical protein
LPAHVPNWEYARAPSAGRFSDTLLAVTKLQNRNLDGRMLVNPAGL